MEIPPIPPFSLSSYQASPHPRKKSIPPPPLRNHFVQRCHYYPSKSFWGCCILQNLYCYIHTTRLNFQRYNSRIKYKFDFSLLHTSFCVLFHASFLTMSLFPWFLVRKLGLLLTLENFRVLTWNSNLESKILCFLRRAQKLTKFSPSIWPLLHNVKLTAKISSIFVAFLENVNFKKKI